MKLLVVGGTGMVGEPVARQLSQCGCASVASTGEDKEQFQGGAQESAPIANGPDDHA
jgi:nucleoside-diphosphate-sugar epimerase